MRWCWAAPASGLTGVYYPEGRIVFDDKPVEEWEFMATGTGVTGLTVNFPDEMVVQVNHSAAIDEGGKLRALGRLHLDLAGRPFANAGQFRMEHDLRKSVITAIAETSEGPVKVEIRAHVPDDLIRIDIHDGRRTPGAMTIRLEEDAPAAVNSDETCGVCFWHENPADAVAPDKPENSGTGADIPGDNKGWLAGRVFGLAVKGEGESGAISDRTLTFPARARHSLSDRRSLHARRQGSLRPGSARASEQSCPRGRRGVCCALTKPGGMTSGSDRGWSSTIPPAGC